jgi:hypothetical protein
MVCRNDWFVFRETEDGAYRKIRTFTACPQIYFTIRNKAETLFLCQRQTLKLSSSSASQTGSSGGRPKPVKVLNYTLEKADRASNATDLPRGGPTWKAFSQIYFTDTYRKV